MLEFINFSPLKSVRQSVTKFSLIYKRLNIYLLKSKLVISSKKLSLYSSQIMLVHYIFCEAATLFSARAVFFLSVWRFLAANIEWWERQIGGREKKRLREAEPAAQFESPSAAGFSFPLPLLSVCFVSSFVLLCLDGERVHAAQHVLTFFSSSCCLCESGLFLVTTSVSYTCCSTPYVYSYSKRIQSTSLCWVHSLRVFSVRFSVQKLLFGNR